MMILTPREDIESQNGVVYVVNNGLKTKKNLLSFIMLKSKILLYIKLSLIWQSSVYPYK